jgi:signal transduction histidine kinase
VNGKVNGASGPLHRAGGWARQTSVELGSVLLYTLGLAATIEWHARQFQRCTGITVSLPIS